MRKALLTFLSIAIICVLLAADAQPKPFEIRGIKGLYWDGIEKYRLALPWLAEHNMNFLMLCYTSFPASGSDWRSEYSPAEIKQFEDLAARAMRLKVDLCLSFNPGIWSKPPLTYSSEQDYQVAFCKVNKVHSLGINWFGLCLDDINRELQPADKLRFGTLQSAQIYFVNRLWNDMKHLKPRPRLIFCPSTYTTAEAGKNLDYIKSIGEGIDPNIMMFWTGPDVCSSVITAAESEKFGQWIKRKPFVWDNYPVNDMYHWRILLGPLKNRSVDLVDAVSGYMANPMKQWYASTIPLGTTASYLNDPSSYDPNKAMEEVFKSFPPDQRPVVRMLVGLYGHSFWGDPGFPPQVGPVDFASANKMLTEYCTLRQELATRADMKNFWQDVRDTLDEDILILRREAEKEQP